MADKPERECDVRGAVCASQDSRGVKHSSAVSVPRTPHLALRTTTVAGLTWEMAIIGAVRVLGSLPVLRWAFIGAIIAIVVDFSDLFLMNLIDLGGVGEYQRFDKTLDQVYMATFLIVALRWDGWTRRIAVGLYLVRLVGVIIYEVTGARGLLPLFPNLFEFWFLFVAAQRRWWPGFRYSGGHIAGWGAALLAAKEAQEYALHTARWLDGFTAVEAVQAIWRWVNT